MALTVQIQPVQIIDKSGSTLSAYVIHYDLAGQNCILYWNITDTNTNIIYDGNYTVPTDILTKWGTDDTLIMNSLTNAMGFVIVPVVDVPVVDIPVVDIPVVDVPVVDVPVVGLQLLDIPNI